MMLLKISGETKSMKWRIGAEEARAPIATCGYFILNQAANTTKQYPFRFQTHLSFGD